MDANSREQVIKLAARISEIRESIVSLQDEMRGAEKELDRILEIPSRQTAAIEKSAAAMVALRQQAEDKSLNQRIIDLIEGLAPGEDIDAEELANALPKDTNLTSVRSGLARLADLEKIRRTTRGRYARALRQPPGPVTS